MTKRSRSAVALVALGALAAVIGMALPAATQAPAERVTLTFFDANGDDFEKEIDIKPVGRFNPGDGAVVWSKMFDPQTCEPVGSFSLNFQYVKPAGKENGWVRILGAGVLNDGDVYFDITGKFSEFEAGMDGGVTGGSGAYKDATGEIRVSETPAKICEKRGALITLDMSL